MLHTASEDNLSPVKSVTDEVDDIESRLKHTTLVHAASSDKALQVFHVTSGNETPPGIRAPGLFDKILSSEDQNEDDEAKDKKKPDTQFYTRIIADNAALEDDIEQNIDDMISRPRTKSEDMTRERVESTKSDEPVQLNEAHLVNRIDVSNLDKLKPLCGIINGFIIVILQEHKDSNRTIQDIVSQSPLRGGFLSTIEHISRYFESDRERTMVELKGNVDADVLCELLNITKQEHIDISDAKSVTFLTYIVRLVGLWTSDMAIVPFVNRGILSFCFYTIQNYSSERVWKMSKYLSDTLQRGEICALRRINEFCDKLRAKESVCVGQTEMSSIQTLHTMILHNRDVEDVHVAMCRVIRYMFRDGGRDPDNAFQLYIDVLGVLKDIASSKNLIEARLMITMSEFTSNIFESLTHFEKSVTSKNADSSLVFECRRMIFGILVTCLHQANHFVEVRLDGAFLSRHLKVLEELLDTSISKHTELRVEFSRSINHALCQHLRLRCDQIDSACINTVIFDVLKICKYLDMSDSSKSFHSSLNALLCRSLSEDKNASSSTCTNVLSSALDVFSNSYTFGDDECILSCYIQICPVILTSLRTLEEIVDVATNMKTRDVVTTSIQTISEALQVVRLISHVRHSHVQSCFSLSLDA